MLLWNHGSNESGLFVPACQHCLLLTVTDGLHLVVVRPPEVSIKKPMCPAEYKRRDFTVGSQQGASCTHQWSWSERGNMSSMTLQREDKWSSHSTSSGPLLGGNLWLWCITLLQGTCCTASFFSNKSDWLALYLGILGVSFSNQIVGSLPLLAELVGKKI